MNPLPLVLATLRRHRAANLLHALLVAAAVGLLVAISAQERAIRDGAARAADPFPLLVGAPGSETDLLLAVVFARPAAVGLVPGEVLAALEADRRVRSAAPVAFGDSWRGHPVVGTDAALVARIAAAGLAGRMFAGPGEAVAGAATGLRPGDRFVPAHGLGPLADAAAHAGAAVTVTGVMAPTGTPWDRVIAVPVEAVWDVHGLALGRDPSGPRAGAIGPPRDPAFTPPVPAIVIEAANPVAAFRLRQEYRTAATHAFFPAETLVGLYGLLGRVTDLLALFALATQVLVILAILAGVLALMRLERRQTAILRALGAPPLYIAAATWGSLAAILLAGCLGGLLFGWAGAALASSLVGSETGLALAAAPGGPELLLAAGTFAAGAVLALLPAIRAARMDVADALQGG